MKYFLNFLVFLILFSACSDGEDLNRDREDTYFPLSKGLFQIYGVEEIRYSVSEDPVELTYDLKAEVVDSFPATGGQFIYVIHRSIRNSDAAGWEPLDTWSAKKSRYEVIVSEGNTPYIKIRFPLKQENTWDGNAFNALGHDEYRLKDIGQSAQLNGFDFSNTITVEQESNGDLIVFRDERKEMYARDAGLIYKELVQLHYCTEDACLGQQRIDHGVEIKMTIREYGKR